MTRPVGRIEVWEPAGEAALYTINDAAGIYYKEIITDGVGHFNFAVYSHKDFSGTYTYPNIDSNDTVKIWLDYDTIAGNPNFIGKVTKRSGPILTETGWIRKIAGLSQGEILLRRQKKNKFYDGTGASTIVTEWANDLSLGTGDITADATAVTLEVRTKSYFDLLRWISDYYDAGGSVKKDFWVDLDGDLVWKVRPLRSAGVESFTTADFLADPLVERDVESVKNDIVVYGAAETFEPQDQDSWTESLTNWTASVGTLSLENATKKYGSYSIECWSESLGTDTKFKRTFDVLTLRDINELRFWRFVDATPSTSKVRLLAPDTSNYFEADMTTTEGWQYKTYSLGPTEMYDVDLNPNGVWTETGSPNWWNMQGIQFWIEYGPQDVYSFIDALYFAPVRWTGSASDTGGGSSQALYGRRDLEVTDDKLHSDSDCTKRAETLLYQLKDQPIQITVPVKGNDNVLVGDRLTITIPSEGITAQPYDVIAVENLLNLDNWTTTITMVNSANWRVPFQLRDQVNIRRRIRELSMNEYGIR